MPDSSTAVAELRFLEDDGEATSSWEAIAGSASHLAGELQRRRLGDGEPVVVAGPISPELLVSVRAVLLAGGGVAVANWPSPSSPAAVVAAIDRALIATGARIVLMSGSDSSRWESECAWITVDPSQFLGLSGPASSSLESCLLPTPSLPAVFQMTSGSTATPQVSVLSRGQLGAQIRAIVAALRLDRLDLGVSWLPPYHDMGLVGMCLTPMSVQCRMIYMDPRTFAARPSRWLEALADGGTITASPSFGYSLAARILRAADDDSLDLRMLRVCLNGGEPIDVDGFERFLDEGQRFGLDPTSAMPAYGMAEICLAASISPLGRGLVSEFVDRELLSMGVVSSPRNSATPGLRLARLGRPVEGVEIDIVNPDSGESSGDMTIGEVVLRGTSLMLGYLDSGRVDPSTYEDKWFHTGDIGYLVDGELVVTGRLKDMIIVGGRNIYPAIVEREVEQVEGVTAGRVIAIGGESSEGREILVVVAETAERPRDDILISEVSRVCVAAVGVRPAEIVLCPPGTVPKTSSGKPQRLECRRRYEAGELLRW